MPILGETYRNHDCNALRVKEKKEDVLKIAAANGVTLIRVERAAKELRAKNCVKMCSG